MGRFAYPLAVLSTWWDLLSASVAAFVAQFQSLQGVIGVLVVLAIWFFPKWSWAKDIEDKMPRRVALVMVAVWFGWVVMITTHDRIAAEIEAARVAKTTAQELERKLTPASVGVTPVVKKGMVVRQLPGVGSYRMSVNIEVVVPEVTVRTAHRETFISDNGKIETSIQPGGTGTIRRRTAPTDQLAPDAIWAALGYQFVVSGFMNGVDYSIKERWGRGPKAVYLDIVLPELTPEKRRQVALNQAATIVVWRINYGDSPSDVATYCGVIVQGPRVIDCSDPTAMNARP